MQGILEYGIEDKKRTLHTIIKLMEYGTNITICAALGSITFNIDDKTLRNRPVAHSIVNIGVHTIFDMGAISGSWLNIDIDKG